MKILKTTLIILVIGFVLFVGIAFLTLPVSNNLNVSLDRPSYIIYNILLNQSAMPLWIPGLKSVNQLNSNQNSIGNESEFIVEIENYKIPIIVEIKDLRNNELIEYRLEHKDIASNLIFDISPSGYKSNLSISYMVKPNNLLTKIAFPLIKPIMKKYIKENEDQLIELLKSI